MQRSPSTRKFNWKFRIILSQYSNKTHDYFNNCWVKLSSGLYSERIRCRLNCNANKSQNLYLFFCVNLIRWWWKERKNYVSRMFKYRLILHGRVRISSSQTLCNHWPTESRIFRGFRLPRLNLTHSTNEIYSWKLTLCSLVMLKWNFIKSSSQQNR